MKLPRDVSGAQFIKAPERSGYVSTRQTGSHVRFTCSLLKEHHITSSNHAPLRPGTLAAMLSDITRHQGTSKDALIEHLFGK